MTRPSSTRGQVQPVVALVLGGVAIAAFVAAVSFRSAAPSAPASNPTSAVPSAVPATPAPSAPAAPASPTPTDAPSVVTRVELDIADDHDVVAAIQDPGAILAQVRSGHAADGMSARWHQVRAENLDDSTIRFTWVGLPQDEQVDVSITEHGAGATFRVVQAGPVANSDALGSDRVLIVSFASPISADDVATEVLDRTVD